jgi:hypothetical protein
MYNCVKIYIFHTFEIQRRSRKLQNRLCGRLCRVPLILKVYHERRSFLAHPCFFQQFDPSNPYIILLILMCLFIDLDN